MNASNPPVTKDGNRRVRRVRRVLVVALALHSGAALPAAGHGGTVPIRPIVTGVEPDVPGLAVQAVYAGAWQVRVENRSGAELAILDGQGRPFLRIGPAGVLADFAAPAWYESNNPEGIARLPEVAPPGVAPDFRLVARGPSWAWYDRRLRADPGLLSAQVAGSEQPVRLAEWSLPVRVAERRAAIFGFFEYEPGVGTYRHRITSPKRPAEGVRVGLVAGGAVPAVTLENTSAEPVTVIGGRGEPMARIGRGVEVNGHSPTWVEVARYLGQTPTLVADADAAPRWQPALDGFRWSWPELRGQPPDEKPPASVVAREKTVIVRRWTVPIEVGDRHLEIRGMTEYVPLAAAPGRWRSTPATAAVLVGVATAAAAAVVFRPRRGGNRSAEKGGTSTCGNRRSTEHS